MDSTERPLPDVPLEDEHRPREARGPRVVVGVADSDESEKAIRWGADHVARTGGTVHLVHAFVWPLMNVDVDPVPGITGSGLRGAAEALLRTAADIAREQAPGIDVRTRIVEGRGPDVLLGASRHADVLAVGSRGLGRVLALIAGSTSIALARRAACPVVVVRGDEMTDGPVGVAYEGSDSGRRALIRAGELAALYGTEVHVVIGVRTPAGEHERILGSVRELIGAEHPEVRVELSHIPSATDARSLIAASEGTRLIVVPPRALEGGVSASSQTGSVLQYAHTPVWVERA